MTFARQYCQMLKDHFAQHAHASLPSPAALLLERGREWTERRRVRWRGTPQACYANAQLYARVRGLRYAEGFATYVIPVEHAWCVDDQDRVIDPTWDAQDKPPDYFGMTFDRDLVRRIRRVTGRESQSLLFTWWKWPEIYPLLTDKTREEN